MRSWRKRLGLNPAFSFVVVLLLLVLQSPFSAAATPWSRDQQSPRDKAEAAQWVDWILRHCDGWKDVSVDDSYVHYSSSRLSPERMTSTLNSDGVKQSNAADAKYKQHSIPLAMIASVSVELPYGPKGYRRVTWWNYSHEQLGWILLSGCDATANTEKFKAALEFLSSQAGRAKHAADFEQFKAQAAAWRAMPAKPAMPEEARQHKVLAEYAYQQRDMEKAIREYTAALNLFPCWPEGQFNLALLAGEQKDFPEAVLHMKEYVELVPDAPDAQAARDKIIIWQDKLNEQKAATGTLLQPQRSSGWEQ